MDLLPGYASSDEEDGVSNTNQSPAQSQPEASTKAGPPGPPKMADRRYLQAAPKPSILASIHTNHNIDMNHSVITLHESSSSSSAPTTQGSSLLLMNNPLKSQLLQPVQGPAILDPHGLQPNAKKKRGDESHIKPNLAFDYHTFEEQRNAFQREGKALAPDERGSHIHGGTYGHTRRKYNKETKRSEFVSEEEYQKEVREKNQQWENEPQTFDVDADTKTNDTNNAKPKSKRKRIEAELIHDSDDEINYGIWGPPTQEITQRQDDQMTYLEKAGGVISSLPAEIIAERAHLAERDRQRGIETESRENQDFDKLVERKMSHLLPPRMAGEDPEAVEATTTFHPSKNEEHNYKGESWIVPSSDFRESAEFGDLDHHKCYVPKKCVARFTGHNKGVHRIRLFPGTGHLLLSAGLDGKCKVWSVAEKKVMRTYVGHSAAVRDVQFNNDGTRFLSCSFDRFIRLWDTETGEVLGTYTNRRVPYVVKFYPKDDNIFAAGCSDNKIVAYNSTSGEIVQEYDHHLAPVNTITFVEDHGMKMITSSDDKKVLIWEWDIGVPIKYISDPTMHSIPVISLHPSGGYFAGQSLDNQIVVYQGRDRFAVQRKKKFRGHQVSGYACDITFSPDGQFICSGDGNGKLCVWEWKRHKLLQKYRAHDKGPTVGCVWHPVLPSTVFTCGWDGVIKMWQ